MPINILPVSALLLGVTGLVLGTGVLGVLLPLRGVAEGFSTLGIAVMGGSYFAGFIAGCLQTPRLVARVGHIRLFASFAAIAAATVIAHALAVDLVVWIVVRAVTGFAVAGLYVVIESWLNHQAANETRGGLFGIYMVVNFVALMAGQLLMVVMDVGAVTPFLVTCLAVCLSLVPVALSRATAPIIEPTEPLGLIALYRVSPLGVGGCFLVGVANGSFWSLGAVFGALQLGSTALAAIFVSVFVLGGALGQWPLGRLSDRWDRRKAIVLACLVGAFGGLLLAFWPGAGIWVVMVLGGLTGMFVLSVYSLCVAHTNDHIESKDFVAASSGLLLYYGAGAVGGPVLAATLMSAIGPRSLFLWTAGAHLALAGFALYRMSQRGPVHEANREGFVTMLRPMPISGEMDPRATPQEPSL
ncbi:MAG: MFS transporter [Proteobacteria bacterium]|nr:MFS transporter [Pseudomonadota bacterium]MDA1058838.1 MFS transporter [Pseudomonadota bacterium]